MSDRTVPDFFDKFAVILGFIGLGVFFLLSLCAIGTYIDGWDPLNDSFSSAGGIIDGNKGAGFLSTALSVGGVMMLLVNVTFIRAIHENRVKNNVKQPAMITGFTFIMVGRAFMILTGAFPSGAWGDAHNIIAVGWLAGELFGVIIVACAMFGGKKVKVKKDLVWGILPFILIGVAIPFWIPYATGFYDIAIPEIITTSVFLAYSSALWIRVWKGNVLLGKARC
ncbi:MAG: hypothetical protein ACTSUE_24340 [Promethearchaeota archaeon]